MGTLPLTSIRFTPAKMCLMKSGKKASKIIQFAFTYDNRIAQMPINQNENHLGLFVLRSNSTTSADKGELVVQNKSNLITL